MAVVVEARGGKLYANDKAWEESQHPRGPDGKFISGSGGQLRKGGLRKNAPQTAAGNDQDNVFMLIEIEGSTLRFEAVSRMGDIVDSGTVELR